MANNRQGVAEKARELHAECARDVVVMATQSRRKLRLPCALAVLAAVAAVAAVPEAVLVQPHCTKLLACLESCEART